MLHYSSIYPPTLELLKSISSLEEFNNFALAGGTSLALQIGHRISVDLDFFSASDFDEEMLLQKLREKFYTIHILHQKKNSLNIVVNDVRTDFITHQYSLCKPVQLIDGIKLYSMQDIAAMKLSAVASRGSKKDFVDIYFLLQHFSLSEMLGFMHAKYPELNKMQVLMSLIYFEDAEIDIEPNMLIPVDWNSIKELLKNEVRKLS